jgi:AraC-like DNA-binding protein
MNIQVSEVLANARLPQDLFARENAYLTPIQYFQLWEGIEQSAGKHKVPLLFAESLSVESFDAPIFAAICSKDFNAAVARIQRYKPLIGPMELDIQHPQGNTQLTISCYGFKDQIPYSYALTELVFFTQLARLCTRQNIKPIAITLPTCQSDLSDYESYFACPLNTGDKCTITFSREDAKLPFMTHNAAMWSFFEDKLNVRLSQLVNEASMTERVRAVLVESLPAGESSVEYVAGELAVSKRTLQRKLSQEAETYQSVLQLVRAELADHYLEKSSMSLGEIAFLLGFQESNSFIRAYGAWKGVSPVSYRNSQH